MVEHVLSAAEWCAYNDLFQLQRDGVIPKYPWDVVRVGKERLRGYDQGMGGDWHIMEQEFVFQWDASPETPSNAPTRQPVTLRLLMRGELPIGPNGKPIQTKEAQRRWFIDKLRLEKPTGRTIGEVQEITVLVAESRDDVMNLLSRRAASRAS